MKKDHGPFPSQWRLGADLQRVLELNALSRGCWEVHFAMLVVVVWVQSEGEMESHTRGRMGIIDVSLLLWCFFFVCVFVCKCVVSCI